MRFRALAASAFAGLVVSAIGAACTEESRAPAADGGVRYDASIDAAICVVPVPEGATCAKNNGGGCVDLVCVDGDWGCPEGATGVALVPGACGEDAGLLDAGLDAGPVDAGQRDGAVIGDAGAISDAARDR